MNYLNSFQDYNSLTRGDIISFRDDNKEYVVVYKFLRFESDGTEKLTLLMNGAYVSVNSTQRPLKEFTLVGFHHLDELRRLNIVV